MRKMETQRRQKGVDREKRLSGGDMSRLRVARQAGNRRQIELERRTMQTSIGQVEKDARIRLAFVPAVMLVIGAVRRAAVVGELARVGVRRFDRTRIAAFRRASVCMMPAAAEHRVQRQRGSHQG